MRKQLPIIITMVIGTIVFLTSTFFAAEKTGLGPNLDKFSQLMGSTAILIGMGTLFRLHYNNIRRHKEHWMFSAWFIVVMIAYFILGMVETNNGPNFKGLYNGIITNTNSTIFAIVAYYIVSSAYRTFRVRSGEATVLLLAAVVTMLAAVPVGQAIWPGFTNIRDWIQNVPNTAATRAVAIGTFLGGYATLLRVFTGMERQQLGAR